MDKKYNLLSEDAVMKLICSGSSISDVAKRANCSRPTLYKAISGWGYRGTNKEEWITHYNNSTEALLKKAERAQKQEEKRKKESAYRQHVFQTFNQCLVPMAHTYHTQIYKDATEPFKRWLEDWKTAPFEKMAEYVEEYKHIGKYAFRDKYMAVKPRKKTWIGGNWIYNDYYD